MSWEKQMSLQKIAIGVLSLLLVIAVSYIIFGPSELQEFAAETAAELAEALFTWFVNLMGDLGRLISADLRDRLEEFIREWILRREGDE